MDKGILYGISVGPGEPELITLKARNILEKTPAVAFPRSGSGSAVALDIAGQTVDMKGKQLLPLDFPMTGNRQLLCKSHEKAADQVCAFLDRAQDVAMLNLGDASLFASWSYLNEAVSRRGYKTVTVPGVTSFCAAAARLNTGLTGMRTPLHIIPGSFPDIRKALALPGSKVIMKSGKALAQVIDAVKEAGLIGKASLVADCGLDNELVCDDLTDFQQDPGYFSLIIIKE